MDYCGADVAVVACLCSGNVLRSVGLLFLALRSGGYSSTTYASCMVYKKRLSFSHYYRPWYDGDILYRCCRSLEPFIKQRSNIDVVPVVDSYDGDVYYYNGYSTATVYYTGHKIIKINGDESRWDDRDKLKKAV